VIAERAAREGERLFVVQQLGGADLDQERR
jgi:hypothetical protein